MKQIYVTLILGTSKTFYPQINSYVNIGCHENEEQALGSAILSFKKQYKNHSIEQTGTQLVPSYMIEETYKNLGLNK